MNKNGYFQIEKKNDGVYLHVIPPVGEGKKAAVDELAIYLDKKKVVYGNLVDLRKSYEIAATQMKPVKISDSEIIPFNGWVEYQVVKDGLELVGRLYPPVIGMNEVTEREVESDLIHMKVIHGIQKNNIKRLVGEKRYLETAIIALGSTPVDGKDAEIIYNFSTEHQTKPKINEDGSVDFHHLDMISSVKANDVVAEIIPEDKGTPGMNIYGVVLPPRKVQRKIFRHGRNLEISPDGKQLISLVTGHITLEGDKVFVSTEYDVPADVNNSTGDIDFDGDVVVKGNVLAGFKVKASGKILVKGVVEGAELIAGGDIILERGILGMNKGILVAGGNIASTFIENAKVRAGGDIDTNAILHSDVAARGLIEVHGKKGYVIGGQVRAGSKIISKIIGSEMGANTIVSVGTDPELMANVNALKTKIVQCRQDKDKLMQIVTRLKKKLSIDGKLTKDQYEILTKTLKELKRIDDEMEDARYEYRNLSELVCEDSEARIQIVGSVYPGTKVEIGDAQLFIREKNDHCQYVKRGVDIVREVL